METAMSDFTGVFPSQAGDPAGQLEELWRRGQRPAVEPFLTRIGRLAPGQLVAVLRVDQYWRWQAGERVLAEVYLEQHAARLTDLEDVLELIYGEYLLREELGEAPQVEEYRRRFPAYAERLAQQVGLHRALQRGAREVQSGTVLAVGEAVQRGAVAATAPGLRYRIVRAHAKGGLGEVFIA